MDELIKRRWLQMQRELGAMAKELSRLQHSRIRSQWSPSLNVYRCGGQYVICVELAGVARDSIEIRAEPRALVIAGVRVAPGPPCEEGQPVQALVMEIDYGRFQRELRLPEPVDPVQVKAEQRDGLLWIYLPLKKRS